MNGHTDETINLEADDGQLMKKSIFQQDDLVLMKTENDSYAESEESVQSSSHLNSSANFILEVEPPVQNCTEAEIYSNGFEVEVKPNIPLLFIDVNKKNSCVCNICNEEVLPSQACVKCSNLCGSRQHLDCLSFKDEIRKAMGNEGIIWQCNDCCLPGSNPPQISADEKGLADGADHDAALFGEHAILALKERQGESGFPFSSSSPRRLSDDRLMSSEICVDEKNVLEQSFDLNDISIDGTLTEEEEEEVGGRRRLEEEEEEDGPSPIKKRKKEEEEEDLPLEKENLSDVSYVVVKRGSRAGKPKLFDSYGFTYVVRKVKAYTMWQCTRCNGHQNCSAYIKQFGNEFYRSPFNHGHAASISEFLAAARQGQNPSAPPDEILFKEAAPARFVSEYPNKSGKDKGNPTPPVAKGNTKKVKLKRGRPRGSTKTKTKPSCSVSSSSVSPSTKKSKYVEVNVGAGGKGGGGSLMDLTLGFSYNLHRTTERTKLWLCCMAATNKRCQATVKQMGNYFIRSSLKHTHSANKKEAGLSKKEFLQCNKEPKGQRLRKPKAPPPPPPQETLLLKEPKQELVEGGEGWSPPTAGGPSPPKHPSALQGKEMKGAASYHYPKKFLALPENDVSRLVRAFLDLDEAGLHLTNRVMIETIHHFYETRGQSDVFGPNQNRPTRSWVCNLVEKNLALQRVHVGHASFYDLQRLSTVRAGSFFAGLGALLKRDYKLELKTFLSKKNARRIFSCDGIELVVNGNGASKKLSLPDLKKNVKEETNRRTMNVLCVISADGQPTKPLIVNKGEAVFKYESREGLDEMYDKLCSPDGEIDRTVFHSWLSEQFDHYLTQNKIPRPVVLFLNGAHCYVSCDSMEFAKRNKIILYHIPSLGYRSNQPLNVSFFQILRKKYQKVFEESLNLNTKQLARRLFPMVFMKAYYDIDVFGLSKSAFAATGICPLNPEAFNSGPDASEADEAQPNNGDSLPTTSSVRNGNDATSPKKPVPRKRAKRKPKAPPKDPEEEEEEAKHFVIKQEKDSPPPPQEYLSPKMEPDGELTGLDKLSLKSGYELALDNVEKLFNAVVDPSVLNLYRQKLEANAEYPDTTFLVWRGLQQLKEVPELIASSR